MHVPSLPGLLVALIVGLMLFGTRRLPEIGASLGQGIREFKNSLREIGDLGDSGPPASGSSVPPGHRSGDPVTPPADEPKRLAARSR